MRVAIDKYKEASDKGQIQKTLDSEGYPVKLQDLVDGVPMMNAVDKKLKFLRRIPIDPMTNSTEWGMRSYQDDPKSSSWGGQNVSDVIQATKYGDW
jgi:general secretion pathway protein G